MHTRLPFAIGFALITAVISGTSIFLNKIAVATVSPPILFTFLKNAVVAMLLVATLFFVGRLGEIKKINKRDWVRLVGIGVVGGSLPFILFFIGLTMTSALTANLIHKSLFIWVALLAVPFLKERVGLVQVLALLLLALGTLLAGGVRELSLGKGELFIFLATLLWALENIIAKKVLEGYSSILVASARMVFGSVILLIVVALPAPFITNLLTAVFITHTFPLRYGLAGVLFVIGVVGLVVRARSFLPRQVLQHATSPVHNP